MKIAMISSCGKIEKEAKLRDYGIKICSVDEYCGSFEYIAGYEKNKKVTATYDGKTYGAKSKKKVKKIDIKHYANLYGKSK